MKWDNGYELAKAYYKHYGHLNVEVNFKTKNGYEYDEDGENLSRWIIAQRSYNNTNKLNPKRKSLLEEIGMNFECIHDLKWEKMYNLAQIYYEQNHHLRVKTNFKTKNGYEYDEDGENLGFWLHIQRQDYKRKEMSPNRIEKLRKIGMIFESINEVNWFEMYLLAQKYYEHYGNILIPNQFKTTDGYTYDKEGKHLGNWLSEQKYNYKTGEISIDRINKLKKIDIDFENLQNIKWQKMYDLAQIYYKHYGNLKISKDFITKNGYTYDKDGEKIGVWIVIQRQKYKTKTLMSERIEKLKQIGMIFENVLENEWEMMYSLATAYYKHYGHLKIKENFKTKNGYIENLEGKNLGTWIISQRRHYRKGRLSDKQIKKLEQIGMIFEIRKNSKIIETLCIEHGIDYNLYKSQISKIPYKELNAKINYLIAHNLPITINQNLNPIFFTSNINLEVRYGINLENLIKQYYISKTKVKGL